MLDNNVDDEKVNDGHIFETSLSVEKFEAVVRRSCRSPFSLRLEAHNPTVLPPVRLFLVEFDAIEDRDRVRIAMRFVEKEMAELQKPATAPKSKPLAARLATA